MKLLSIGEVDYLPYDVTHMTALPTRENVLASSVLCFSPSIIVHVNTTSGFGVYVNANGKEAVANVRQSANILYTAVQWEESAQARSLRVVKTNLNFANCAALLINSYYNDEDEKEDENENENENEDGDSYILTEKGRNVHHKNVITSLSTQRSS